MIILEDTRQKIGKHQEKYKWFRNNGIIIRRTKLYVGDYTLPTDSSRCVDTKEGVLELLSNLHGQHDRFRGELVRAQESGIEILILVEECLPDGGILSWESPIWHYGKKRGLPITRASMSVLKKTLLTISDKYGAKFSFTDPKYSGETIIDYLKSGKCDVTF